MNRINKLKFYLLLLFFLFASSIINAKLPEKCLGNWINIAGNNWEYGFFEEFAIFENDFWEYESVEAGNKGATSVILKKGTQNIRLKILEVTDKQLRLKPAKGKTITLERMGKLYPGYNTVDASCFPKPTFRADSVTITGYLRNINYVPEQDKFVQRLSSSKFKIIVPDFINDVDQTYITDIDSLGRFKITFPIMNTQCLHADAGRTNQTIILSPGDKIFLYADLFDFIQQEGKNEQNDDVIPSKGVLYMGDNSRLNNELVVLNNELGDCVNYVNFNDFKRSDYVHLSDIEYLKKCEEFYNLRKANLNDYIQKRCVLSEKLKCVLELHQKYDFARDLMQRRFNNYNKNIAEFEEGYMDYVHNNISLEDELAYTFNDDFKTFITDYIGYYENPLIPKSHSITLHQIAEQIIDKDIRFEGMFTRFETLARSGNDSVAASELQNVINEIYSYDPVKECISNYFSEKNLETKIEDSLISSDALRQLLRTKKHFAFFDTNRRPLPDKSLRIMRDSVSNRYLSGLIEEKHNYYSDLKATPMLNSGSLKNTEAIKEHNEADKLFSELINPYKGKVIYMDFWGTWCGPCRESIKHAADIKEQLKDKDVMFIYMANNSPEESWTNFIKEMDLTGESIVHYRLPDSQQKLIEKMFNVNHYPTYMLIDKDGNVVNQKAPWPQDGEYLISEIMKLLQ